MWWAILKDICDALKLRTDGIAQRLDPNLLERVLVETSNPSSNGDRSNIVSNDLRYEHNTGDNTSDIPSKYIRSEAFDIDSGVLKYERHPGDNKTRWMLAVNELGIYEALFASRKLEARKFRMWAGTVIQKLRTNVGLKGYEVMRMTDPDIQDEIDQILDTLYWDDEKKMVMQSITLQGGDVDQILFE